MDSSDALINELRSLVAKQAAWIAELQLKLAKALKDSSTISNPPSSDIAKKLGSPKPLCVAFNDPTHTESHKSAEAS